MSTDDLVNQLSSSTITDWGSRLAGAEDVDVWAGLGGNESSMRRHEKACVFRAGPHF